MKLPNFKPGKRIYFTKMIGTRLVIRSETILNTRTTYNSSVERAWSSLSRKFVNKVVHQFVEMKIITKGGHQFTYDENFSTQTIFKTRLELTKSFKYRNHIF